MARQLGLLERARLEQEFDQAKAMAEKLRILHTLGMAIASAMDLEQVLTRIVEAAVFITEAEEGSLLLLDEETGDLHLRAQKGLGDKYARGFRMPVQDSLAGDVLRTGRPERLEGQQQDFKVVTGYLVTSILYVPVAIQGTPIGVLAVDNQTSDTPFTQDDENLLLVLAGYAAIALEKARRVEESERKFQVLAALHGAGELALGEPLDAEVSGILVGDGEAEAQALCPEYLSTVVAPCLNAICALQGALDELAGRPPAEIRVLAIIQDWPISISLAEATEALLVIDDMVLPKARRWAREGDALAVELGISIVSRFGPNLLESQRVGLVSRLLPSLETLLSVPLQVSVTSVSSG
ncbi:MAG: GAF domain-containing protein [Anaerolineae bacterium]|nr:GAF domain-containing protein [Anaerolineae bacterium]